MAKSDDPREEGTPGAAEPEPEESGREGAEEAEARPGLSKEAWVAISAMVAALITGVVTVMTHLLPQAPRPSSSADASTPPESSAPASPSPKPPATSAPADPATAASEPAAQAPAAPTPTADAIAGSWGGTARDGSGTTFRITLEVGRSCAPGERCGTISVSHVPCYGAVFLEDARETEFEFRVADFYGESDRSVCQPGAGEHFRLRADGALAYTTGYDPATRGVLERTGE